jgi:hypothetical protein
MVYYCGSFIQNHFMKNKTIAIIAVMLLQHFISSGQTFALAGINEPQKTGNPATGFCYGHEPVKWNKRHTTGMICMGVGSTVVIAGLYTMVESNDGFNAGIICCIGGAAVNLVGTIIFISGGKLPHPHRVRMVSPKRDQVGLAYNF